jgi:hypothetical protein
VTSARERCDPKVAAGTTQQSAVFAEILQPPTISGEYDIDRS